MIVVDTSLFFANFSRGDGKHELARLIFGRILDGRYGTPVLLDQVYNELMTLTYIRTKNIELCRQLGEFLMDHVRRGIVMFIHTPVEIFWKAEETFLTQVPSSHKRFLSYTDAIIGEMAEWLNAEYIGTFDSQFHRFNPQVISE